MLATLTDKPFNRHGWIFELKWDGYRAITEIESGEIRLYSRKGNSLIKDYPPIVEALKLFRNDVVLDGEIIALKDGKPDFHALQNYEESRAPLQYVIFDLLYHNGHDLRSLPLFERKALLRHIFPHHPSLLLSEHIEENGEAFFDEVKKQAFEGMIAKDGTSAYLEGKRGLSWLKIKHFHEQEAIIVGYTEPRGSRKKLGALVLAAHDKGNLKYIGHSGGGFSWKELSQLHTLLSADAIKDSPLTEKVPINSPITWVKPKYVCQIKFSEWTRDGRMRHPIYAGLREDKSPKEVIVEKPAERPQFSGQPQANVPTFSNRDKVFWPREKYTKGDVIDYYDSIAELILPYLIDRPESLHRHPNGIEGKSFFHKDMKMHVPEFVETHNVWSESNGKDIRYLLCQNKDTLLYLANLGCIELNPWNSRIQNLEKPDYLIIDLDPGDNTFDELVKVALVTHGVLENAGMPHFCKTSGKTGLHIFVPVGAQYDYDTIRNFSHLLVQIIHKKIPGITSIERSPAKRKNKIYLDYLQNRRGQTIAAPYSLRPYPGATVSTPLEWKEVKKGLNPGKFTIETIHKRLDKKGDLWAGTLKNQARLHEAMQYLQKEVEKDL
jgi:bifunctional non-homologous end joining protein LigD